MNCPAKHGLANYKTSTANISCDICKHSVTLGDFAFGCRKCNYDVCYNCYSEHVDLYLSKNIEKEEIKKDNDGMNKHFESWFKKNIGLNQYLSILKYHEINNMLSFKSLKKRRFIANWY